MSDAPGPPPLGVDAIAEPATPPPALPDERTEAERQEFLLYKELASKPAFRSVFLSERENKRLRKELDDVNRERREFQACIHHLGPENALLKQAMHDLRGNFTIAALLLTGGSTSVSIAGAISNPTLKPITLISGVAASIIGFVLTMYTFLWIKPRSPA